MSVLIWRIVFLIITSWCLFAFSKAIFDTEIVFPKRLKSCHHATKNYTQEDSMLICYTIQTKQFFHLYLILKPKNDFLAPNFVIEQRVGDLYQTADDNISEKNCFYTGTLVNETESKVTLNLCGGLQGLISSTHGDLFLTPATNGLDNQHLLYFQSEKLAKEDGDRCGLIDSSKPKKLSHKYELRPSVNLGAEAVPVRQRARRSLSVRRYIETLVVADQSMFEFYNRNEVELRRYLLSVMAMVSSIMKDSSIGNFVDVSVVRLMILKKNPPTLNVTRNASQSLRKFCKWQRRQNKFEDSNPEYYDTAVLITRKDLCTNSKCDTLGLAELGSMCDPVRSCSIVEDNGLSVAFTAAHELGHLLNAPHDGINNHCTENLGKVHIMTPSFSIHTKTWTWSSCSRNEITTFLESAEATCLSDKPSPKFEHPLPHKLPGEMFSQKEQCQLIYGPNSTVCPFVRQCHRIWCIEIWDRSKLCHTNNMPWADGTKCDTNAWCIRGHCEPKENFNLIHGQWGTWGEFGECSRTCGGGIKVASRECNNPKPAYNGNYCVGQRHKYESCNTENCQRESMSFRGVQCLSFQNKKMNIPGVPQGVRWIPKYSIDEESMCKLYCEIKGYGIFYELTPKVIDGTKCTKNTNNICVDGQCKIAGCDNLLGSNAKVDKCGICNGDNSTCRTSYGYKNTSTSGYNFVVHVPRGAYNLNVVQQSANKDVADTHFLALLDQQRRYIFNGDWRVSLGRKHYNVRGNRVYYSGPNAPTEKILVKGKLQTALEIRVLSIGESHLCNIKYSYNMPVYGPQKFKWVLKHRWTECYLVCQGFQSREYECQRDFDGQVVSETKCTESRPAGKMRSCNLNCRLKWSVFRSECSPISSCGNGVQEQKVTCVKSYDTSQDKDDEILTNRECLKAKFGPKPHEEIPCFTPCTKARWIYTAWSKCNKTCDRGLQNRNAICMDQSTNTSLPFANCNISQGPLLRPCNMHPCPKWHTGTWSGACSVTCGRGEVTRLVHCVSGGVKASPSKCANEVKPSETRPCIMSPCSTWKVRPWAKCSKTCGSGYQIREVFCETGVGEKVDEAECVVSEKPIERQRCFENACQLKAKFVENTFNETNEGHAAKWLTSDWKECSVSCGDGLKHRAVGCVSLNTIISDAECEGSRRPDETQSCNNLPCPFWRHGQWSVCSKSCDNGIQTRLVLCGFNGTILSNDVCRNLLAKTRSRACNVHECQSVQSAVKIKKLYEDWQVSEWSECSTTCGEGGVATRTVACINATCNEEEKPRETKSCTTQSCPRWNYGEWAPCQSSRGCGDGWQVRLVVCQLPNGRVLNASSCNQTTTPLSNQTCALHECKESAAWKATPWQPCNVVCGRGFQYRYVSCEDATKNVVADELCHHRKPADRKPCQRESCPMWVAQRWGECQDRCFQQRRIDCVKNGTTVNWNLCKLEDQPLQERECLHANCPRVSAYTWRAEKWSSCSRSCGYSRRTRAVVCVDKVAAQVEDAKCEGRRPVDVEQCFEGPCPPTWLVHNWEECSVSCGGGVQSRNIHCLDESRNKMPDEACAATPKEISLRRCNLGSCGDNYRWEVGPWKECSLSCNVGETNRDVYCVNNANVTESNYKCVAEHMPPNYKVCNTFRCPLVSCRDVQREFHSEYDGEQMLMVGGRLVKIYCEGMHRQNPKEFITLVADPKENFAEIYGKRLRQGYTCPENGRRQIPCLNCIDYSASGVTFFKKVRLDIRRMVIVPEDKTFADQFGRNPPGFASAGDCYSRSSCPQGRFMINLKETGLRVADDVTWNSRGYYTSQRVQRSEGNQVVYGKCGGYCGMCTPSHHNGLKVEVTER